MLPRSFCSILKKEFELFSIVKKNPAWGLQGFLQKKIEKYVRLRE